MCNGFPFTIGDVRFHNSECAYIAGSYASNNKSSEQIQRMISLENNGYLAKRIYRNKPSLTQHMRKDWDQYNTQWMLLVIWLKSIGNSDFADLLRQIPQEAHIVENTTLMTGRSSILWGAKNKELMAKRKRFEEGVAYNESFKSMKDLQHAQMVAANQINDVGVFEGQNVMGKILKLCSLSLIKGDSPPLDLELLSSKKLYLAGERLTLERLHKFCSPGAAQQIRNPTFSPNKGIQENLKPETSKQ
jgi:hypothetical protein